MKNKTTIWVIVLVLVLAALLWYFVPREGKVEPIQAYFTSSSGQSVMVLFNPENRTAELEGLGFDRLVLTQGLSASGARYVNEGEGLELWNKGNEVTISKGEKELFKGMMWNSASENLVPPTELYIFSGPTWVWDRTELNDGSIVRPKKPGEYAIRFEAEGKVFGDTDCNNFSGTYSAGTGNTLAFGPFMSTLMFCEGSQETEFAKMVSDSTQYTFTPEGDLVLMIKFDSGSVIFKKR